MKRNPASLRPHASLAVGAVAFIAYLITLAPSVDFIDAGELAAVAHTWGIAHPTGYPLFTLLAALWSYLPLGDGILRMNVFAALLSAVSAGVMVQVIWVLLGIAPKPRQKGKRKKKSIQENVRAPDPAHRLQAAVIGALVLAFSGTFWRTALSIEVYSLHMLMLSLLMWSSALLLSTPEGEASTRRRRLLITALLLGLAFGNHMSTIFFVPALALTVLWRFGRDRAFWRDVSFAVPVFAAGLLSYLYLPLRAAADPFLNWGNPDSLERFIWHISGKQYSVWMFSSFDAWKEQFAYAFTAFGRDTMYIGAVAALVGITGTFRRRGWLGAWLLMDFLTCLFWAAGYDIHDIDTYFLLGFFVIAVWAAFAVMDVLQGRQRQLKGWLHPAGVAGAVLIIPLLLGGARVSQSGNYLVEDYTKSMFASFGEDAYVLSFQWDYWVSASYYYQLVEDMRTDVIVIDKELMRRSWYLEQIRVNYPELYAASKTEIAQFEEELYKFEHDLPYNPEIIEAAFNRMVNSFFDHQYGKRPLYVTHEIEEQFAPGYVRVPEGLALRLYRPEDVPAAAEARLPELQYRPFESDDRLVKGIKGMYATMLFRHATYQHRAENYDAAAPLFEKTLEFVPGDANVMSWMRRNEQRRAAGE